MSSFDFTQGQRMHVHAHMCVFRTALPLRSFYFLFEELGLTASLAAMSTQSPPRRRPSSGPDGGSGGYTATAAAPSPPSPPCQRLA
eukprot:5212148-Pyramimonas_sp.AAC.1